MTARLRRFTATDPCPICGGHDGAGPRPGPPLLRLLRPLRRLRPLHPRGEGRGPAPQPATAPTATGFTAAALPLRPVPRPVPRPRGQGPPRRPGHAQAPGRAAIPLVSTRSRPSSAAATARGRTIRHWIYRDAAGTEAFRVLRIDYRAPDGSQAKSYRPCHQGRRRQVAAVAARRCPLPLYNLPAILAAPPEADRRPPRRREMRRPRHGPRPAARHDQRPRRQGPAAHRLVAAGRPLRRHPPRRGRKTACDYAAQVAALLAALDPPARVHIVSPARPLRRRGHRAVDRRPPHRRPHRRRHPRRAAQP